MKQRFTAYMVLMILAFTSFFTCKKEKDNPLDPVPVINEPPPLKTVTARVLEYGTDNPIAGAGVSICTSPRSFYQCDGEFTRATTDNNGQAIFTTRQYIYGSVEKTGYFQNVFNPCFIKYEGADSMAGIHTSDRFIVRVVPKTDFTLHIKDVSGANPGNGISMVADVRFHGCVSSRGVLTFGLHPGIDTTIIVRNFWGNTNYLFRVGRNYESDCDCFSSEFYNQVKFVANGNSSLIDITY
jgi:hypothetical protein